MHLPIEDTFVPPSLLSALDRASLLVHVLYIREMYCPPLYLEDYPRATYEPSLKHPSRVYYFCRSETQIQYLCQRRYNSYIRTSYTSSEAKMLKTDQCLWYVS